MSTCQRVFLLSLSLSLSLSHTHTHTLPHLIRRGGGKSSLPGSKYLSHLVARRRWENSLSAKVMCGFFVFLGIYLFPTQMPKLTEEVPLELQIQGTIGGVLLSAGIIMYLMGPWLQEMIGWWSLGLAPISSIVRQNLHRLTSLSKPHSNSTPSYYACMIPHPGRHLCRVFQSIPGRIDL
jgi:hypothetical protein